MEIIEANADDVCQIRSILMDAFDSYVRKLGRELNESSFGGLADAIEAGDVWLAKTPECIAGVITVSKGKDGWLIGEIAVAPGQQGHGVGSRLLQSVHS